METRGELSTTCNPKVMSRCLSAPDDIFLSDVCPHFHQWQHREAFLDALHLMRKRGRPKGTNDTVIGLPTKKKKANSVCSTEGNTIFEISSLKEKGKFAHFLLFVC